MFDTPFPFEHPLIRTPRMSGAPGCFASPTLPLEVKVKIPTQPNEGWMGHPIFIYSAKFLPEPPASTHSRGSN